MGKRKSRLSQGSQGTLDYLLHSLTESIEKTTDKSGRLISEIFSILPSRVDYPDYYDIISTPMAIESLTSKIDQGFYSTLQEYYDDFKTMIENAKIYNRKGSQVYKDAVALMNAFEELYSVKVKQLGSSSAQSTTNVVPQESTPLVLEMNQVIKSISALKSKDGHLTSELFQQLPDANEYPDYYQQIETPIALDIISKKIERQEYQDWNSLASDFDLMISNAKSYNAEGSFVYNDALQLHNAFKELIKSKDSQVSFLQNVKQVESIQYKNQVYSIGDFVYISNPGSDKPIIGHIYELWTEIQSPHKPGFRACWFLLPEQTIHKATTKFLEKEVLKTSRFENYSMEKIQGKCWILFVKDYIRGRPKGSSPQHTYVCESRYNEATRTMSKIKNWSNCLPDSVKNIELDLELFDVPMVPLRGPSALVEQQQQQASSSSLVVSVDKEESLKKRISLVVDKKSIPSTPAVSSTFSNIPTPNMGSSASFSNLGSKPISSSATQQINPAYYNSLANVPGEAIPEKTAELFEQLPDGKVKWFSGPPLDIVGDEPLKHSLEYLHMRVEESKSHAPAKGPSTSTKGSSAKASANGKEESPSKKQKTQTSSQSPNKQSTSTNVNVNKTDKDWRPLTKVLEDLANVWLKEAETVNHSIYS